MGFGEVGTDRSGGSSPDHEPPSLSVIVPVYNGEATVRALYAEIAAALGHVRHEVVFVCDGGPGAAWEELEALKDAYSAAVTIVRLSRNYGQHNAIICGFSYARGRHFVTMDEDLQHDAADIPAMLATLERDRLHLVYGIARETRHSVFRRVTSSLLRGLLRVGLPELHPDYSAFRVIRADIARETIPMRNAYTFLDGYLAWLTQRVGSCEVSHRERYAGQSAYSVAALVEHSVNIFFTFSKLPARLLSLASVTILTVSTAYATYVVARKLIYDDLATGYPSLVAIIGFGIGFIMLALGIIGEYLYRVNLKTTKRPNYNVEEVL